MEMKVDSQNIVYALQGLRAWILELENALEKAILENAVDVARDQEFLFQVTVAQERIMENYKKAYIPTSNMVEPSVLDIKHQTHT